MEYRRLENDIVLRLDRGEEIIACLKDLARREKIAAADVRGIGALSETVMGCFSVDAKKFVGKEYRGDLELTTLLGSITSKDGEPYVHLHLTVADETGATYGGHAQSAVVGMTGELFIRVLPVEVDRRFDDSLGINVFKF